jgi:uncharacterized protein (DUF924 family)
MASKGFSCRTRAIEATIYPLEPFMTARQVLDFWFFSPLDPDYGQLRPAWFRKDAQFDAQIRAQFGPLIGQACAGGLREWDLEAGPAGTLARILVLDQFTRNAQRDTPAAFAGDALALAAASELVDSGADRQLTPAQRAFAYMPFEHAEDGAMQQRAVDLFTALVRQDPAFAGMLDYARQHQAVIARFGRFPHRNRILGRPSSAQEQAYLDQPGAGF